jgi:hypothetical protein
MKHNSKFQLSSYVKGIIFLIIYIIFTRALFVSMVLIKSTPIALIVETISPSLFGILFLYIFSHEHLFAFARVIRERKIKTEEKFLDNFLRFGKFAAVFLIGYIAGPLFAALTTYLLLSTYKYKYYLVVLVSGSSSFLAICLARGILHLVIRLT